MLDREILERARDQHGVLGVRQLRIDHGVTAQSISRARRQGIFVDVLPGVIRIASSPLSLDGQCMAVQLWAGACGFLSGWTSAHRYGLRAMSVGTVHYTVPASFHRATPSWVRLRRCGWIDLDRDRIRADDGSFMATPLRMLFGLAAEFNQYRFERAAEDAWHRRLTTPAEAAVYLDEHRCRGKDGVKRFERWLAHALSQPRPAQSNLERRLLEALEGVGIPRPVRQHPLVLPDGDVIHLDIAWTAVQLAVEPGAAWWHGGDLGQRRDQDRDRACAEIGWHVVRFDEQMRRDPRGAALQIARIHASRAALFRNLSA